MHFPTEVLTVIPAEFVGDKFEELRGLYTRTFLQISSIVCKRVPLEELIKQIEVHFPDLEDRMKSTNTVDDVMKFFRQEKCNFPYFQQLRGLVFGLGLDEAVQEIDRFASKRKKIYKKILAKDFAKLTLKAYDRNNDVQVGRMFD